MMLLRAQCGDTALTRAAAKDHSDCLRLLLEAGADKDAKNEVRASKVPVLCLSFADFKVMNLVSGVFP